MSESVFFGGTQYSWLQSRSDDEILEWSVDPPSFANCTSSVRNRVRQQVGHVEIPTNWDGAHSEVRRLLKTDAGRLERKRRVSVLFPWQAPRFDSTLGQRQLRILNAIFLAVIQSGGSGHVGGRERLETSVQVYDSVVHFKLTSRLDEGKKAKRNGPVWDGHVDGLRLSILDAHGSTPERLTWEDGEGKTIETHISEIVVELITTAEIQYRESCARHHSWIMEQKEVVKNRLDHVRQLAEMAASNQAIAVAKEKLHDLLKMAENLRHAQDIRALVKAMRIPPPRFDNQLAKGKFEKWCRWALSKANEFDPKKSKSHLFD
ncbi:MAG TPA: hypothetical protein VKC60_08475 [Opitutaceae bacterium]|nr:hypothetical protein [Opitutaceae bacterium]